MSKYAPKSFLWGFYGTLLFLFFLWVSFNILVDPFGYFNLANIKWVNSYKPQMSHQVRLAKTHHLYRQQPTNVIVGSSRVEIAFDPNYLAWKNFPGKTYNLGMPGIGLLELYKNIVHAYHVSKNLKRVIVVLDFFMFNAHREAVVFETEVFNFDENRLMLNPHESYVSKFLYDIDFFLGKKGTVASFYTLIENAFGSKTTPDYYQITGMRDQEKNTLKPMVDHHGHRCRFCRVESDFVEKIWRAGPERRYCFNLKNNNTIETFRNLIDFAYEHDLDLRLVIGPEHARMLIAIKEAGLWVQFEDWKRQMVQILEEEGIRYNKKSLPLWDFSGFNYFTTEVVPQEGDRTSMKYYWEGSHYKTSVGEIIINEVLNQKQLALSSPKEVGVKLILHNIENHLIDLRNKISIYEKKFSEETTFIKKVVAEILLEKPGSNCGYEFLELNKGIEVLKKGEQKNAKVIFKQAEKIHQMEEMKAQRLHLPFREQHFPEHLKMARLGKTITPPPIDWIGYQERGNQRRSTGDLAGAIADYSQAIKKGPLNSALHFLRGTAYLELKNYENALKDFRLGLEITPGNPSLLSLKKQAEEALNTSDRILSKRDKATIGRLNFQKSSNTRRNKRNFKGTIADLEAIQMALPNTRLYDIRGIAYAALTEKASNKTIMLLKSSYV